MSGSNDVGAAVRVPIFPLPGTVFFPNMVLPLHVFEERYRAMVADALNGDRSIAIALLKPGYEPLYDTKAAPIHETVCVGTIAAEERLEDGRYHLLLRGVSRARIVDEPDGDEPYRVGRLELLDDVLSETPSTDPEVRRAELLWQFRHAMGGMLEQALHRAGDPSVPLGTLCDVIASALVDVPAERRQPILAATDVEQRSERLLELLRTLPGRTDKDFPPQFSLN